jgi:hypothetical protein
MLVQPYIFRTLGCLCVWSECTRSGVLACAVQKCPLTSLREPLVGAARVHETKTAFAGAVQLHEGAGPGLCVTLRETDSADWLPVSPGFITASLRVCVGRAAGCGGQDRRVCDARHAGFALS